MFTTSTSNSLSFTLPTIKRKKLPACDYCKARRVLCHPQPAGISCPRCLEKGVQCTTTPVIRRKRRTKAEIQQANLGAAGQSESTQSASTPPMDDFSEGRETSSSQPDVDQLVPSLWGLVQRNALTFPTLAPPSLDLPASLVSGLFQTFRELPHYQHPVIPIRRLQTTLQRSAWQLSALPPQDRVLVQCILAVSSLSSTDSLILGSLDQNDVFTQSTLAPTMSKADLRKYGQRRELVCQQLRGEAMKLAIQEGVTVYVSQENAASCALLEFLEYRATGQGASPYAMAYSAHLRNMHESPESTGSIIDEANMIRWPSFLMQDALCALSSGRSLPFSKHDELLLCGDVLSGKESSPTEEALEILLSDKTGAQHVFPLMGTLTTLITHLARESSERLIGAYARREPLNEAALTLYLTSLDTLHTVVKTFKSKSDAIITTTQDKVCVLYLQMCTFGIVMAWASLVLPLYTELERRYFANLSSSLVGIGTGNNAAERARARLELFYKQVRGMTLRAALELAEVLIEVPSIDQLTHMYFGDIGKWARLLLEAREATEITQMERLQALERFRDTLKLAGFSSVDRTGLVEAIEAELPNIALESEQGLFSFSAIQNTSTPEMAAQTPGSTSWFWPGQNMFQESTNATSSMDAILGFSMSLTPEP